MSENQEYQANALVEAIKSDNNIVEILKHPENYDPNYVDKKGQNVLFYTIKYNMTWLTSYLIGQGTYDLNNVDTKGNNILMYIFKFHRKVTNRMAIVDLLYNIGTINLQQINHDGETFLMLLCQYFNKSKEPYRLCQFIKTYIESGHANVDFISGSGKTALRILVKTARWQFSDNHLLKIVKILLETKKALVEENITDDYVPILTVTNTSSIALLLLREVNYSPEYVAKYSKAIISKFLDREWSDVALEWIQKYLPILHQDTLEVIWAYLWQGKHEKQHLFRHMLRNYQGTYMSQPKYGMSFLMNNMFKYSQVLITEFIHSEHSNVDFVRISGETALTLVCEKSSNENLPLVILKRLQFIYESKAMGNDVSNSIFTTAYNLAKDSRFDEVVQEIDKWRQKESGNFGQIVVIKNINLECAICLTKMQLEIALSPCGHVNIHKDCYQRCLRSIDSTDNGQCPICRASVQNVLQLYGEND